MSWMTNKKINTRIISILFAVALWLYVASEQNPTEHKPIKDVPVRLVNTETIGASGLIIRDPQQYKVDVNLQGKRIVLAEIKAGDIIAEADLRGYTKRGVNNVPVEIRGLPSNVELTDYSPKSIKIEMEQISSIQVPVTLTTEGKPLEGYTALPPVITPGEVLVNGPESVLGSVRVLTAVMKLSGASADLKQVLAVRAVDADNNNIAGVTVNPETVEVTVPVRKTKTVRIEPVIVGQPSADWMITDITQNRQTVLIYGEDSVLQAIDSIKTQPVSLDGVSENTSINVGLVMPEGIASVENISSVTVYVRGVRMISKELIIDRVNFTGIGENLKLSEGTAAPSVRVTLRGREDIANRVTADDVTVTASLAGLGEGRHTVALDVKLPEDIQLVAVIPQRVEVELATLEEDGQQ
jgi:YbbR domain-containing protein